MAKSGHRGDKGGGGALQEAIRRYEAGDQPGARREARRVLEGSPSDADRAEAEALLSRTRLPTWAWPYAVVAGVLLALMVALAIARG
jgi:hypothetical protein